VVYFKKYQIQRFSAKLMYKNIIDALGKRGY
jgi:hypothetical protein